MNVPEIKTQNILATGGIFLIALAMIIYSPSEQCIETEFFGNKIVKCDSLIKNPFTNSQNSIKEMPSPIPSNTQFELNLTNTKWNAVNSASPNPGLFEFLDTGIFILTEFNSEGSIYKTTSGEYKFNFKAKKLQLTIESKIIEFTIYDIKKNSFKIISLDDGNSIISLDRKPNS